MLDDASLRALVVMIAQPHTPGRDAQRERWSKERCLQWMDGNAERVERKIRSIVAVDTQGRYYGYTETVTGYSERERAQLFRF